MTFPVDGGDSIQKGGPFMDWPRVPLSTTVRVAFGARTHCGQRHAINEDHYLVLNLSRHQETLLTTIPDELVRARFDEYGYAMVVADGMGENGTGEAASHLAIATLVYLVRHFGKWNVRVDDMVAQEIMDRAERFYRFVHHTVTHEGQKNDTKTNQTTLTAAFSGGQDLFFAHVGHSRAYLFRQGNLVRLTRDHTIGRHYSKTVPIGPLIDSNATALDLKHIFTDAMGMAGTPKIDLGRLQLEDNDIVLVCTNGVSDIIDEPHIEAILASDRAPGEQCQALLDLALESGGEDDATALIGHYRIPE